MCSVFVIHREMCAVRLLFIERCVQCVYDVCGAFIIHRDMCAVCLLFVERGVQDVLLWHSKVMSLSVSAGGHHGSQRLPGRSSHHEGDEASQSSAVVR